MWGFLQHILMNDLPTHHATGRRTCLSLLGKKSSLRNTNAPGKRKEMAMVLVKFPSSLLVRSHMSIGPTATLLRAGSVGGPPAALCYERVKNANEGESAR